MNVVWEIVRNSHRHNWWVSFRLISVALMGGLLAGCSTPAPTQIAQLGSSTPIESSLEPLVVSPPASEMPPPTWTPIPSLTPYPTATPLPPSLPAPTFTVAELCQYFEVIAPHGNAQFDYAAVVIVGWKGVPLGSGMVMTITQQGGKAGLHLDAKFDGGGLLPIPLKRLPSPGPYVWAAWVQHPDYGPICEKTGAFVRKELVVF